MYTAKKVTGCSWLFKPAWTILCCTPLTILLSGCCNVVQPTILWQLVDMLQHVDWTSCNNIDGWTTLQQPDNNIVNGVQHNIVHAGLNNHEQVVRFYACTEVKNMPNAVDPYCTCAESSGHVLSTQILFVSKEKSKLRWTVVLLKNFTKLYY